MNVERFLREYQTLGEELIRLNRELNEIICCKEDCYNTLQAQNLTGMPKDQTPEDRPSSVERAVIKISDRYGEAVTYYTNRINDLLDQKRLFEATWSDRMLLSSSERTIITLRYIQDMPWSLVCRKVHYGRTRATAIAQDAMKRLQTHIDELEQKERTKVNITLCYS